MRATTLFTIGLMLSPAWSAAAAISTPAQNSQTAAGNYYDTGSNPSNSYGKYASESACESSLLTSWENNMPALGFGSTAAAAAMDAAVRKMLDHAWLDHPQFVGGRWPAFSIAISNGSKLVFARSYGYADMSTLQPAHPDNLFRLASDSKQITGATILKLIADGQSVDGNPAHKLTLDSKIFQILTSAPNAIVPLNGPGTLHPLLKDITVEDVLHHTGGWMPGIGDPVWYAGQPGATLPPTEHAIVSYMMNRAPEITPHGSKFSYSNFGYNLLATLITKITGKDYEQVVKEKVLTPLGIDHTQVGHSLPGQRVDGEVHQYSFAGILPQPSLFPSVPGPIVGEDKIPYGSWSLEAGRGAGGWIASSVDTLKFQLGVDGRGTTQVYPNIFDDIKSIHNQPSQAVCLESWCTSPTQTVDPSKNRYNAGWGVNYWGWKQNYEDFEIAHGGGTADSGSYTESIPGTPFFSSMTPQPFLYGWSFVMNTAPATLPSNETFNPADTLRAVMFDQIKSHQSLLAQSLPADTDFFDQYGEFTPWTDEASFVQMLNMSAHYGCTYKGKLYHSCYPSRLEGKAPALCLKNGTCPEYYRAQFVPVHAGWNPQVLHGASCSQYVAKSNESKANGYQQINLQWYRDQNGRMNIQSVWVKQ